MADQYPLPISARYLPGMKQYHDADDYNAKEGHYPDAFDVSKPVKRWSAPGTSFHTWSNRAPDGLVAFTADGPTLNLPGLHTNVVSPPYVQPTTSGTYDAGTGGLGIVPASFMATLADVQLLVSRLGNGATFYEQDVINSLGHVVPVTYSGDQGAKYYGIKATVEPTGIVMNMPAAMLVREMYQHGVNSLGKYVIQNGHLVVFPAPTEPVAGGPAEVGVPIQLEPGEVLVFGPVAGTPTVQLPGTNSPTPTPTPQPPSEDVTAALFQIQQTLYTILALVQKGVPAS